MIGRQYSALGQTFTVSANIDIFAFGFLLFAMNLLLMIMMCSIYIEEKR